MNWKYESTLQEHQLAYNKSVLARIQVSPRKYGGFQVAALVSGIYYGTAKQQELARKNQEWVACKRKFKTKDSAELYVSRKKAAVLNFIKSREKEG